MEGKEDIINQIEKFKVSIKKVRKSIPFAAFFVIITLQSLRWGKQEVNTNSYGMIGALLLYISTFIYAYLRCRVKIKKLEKQLQQP